MIHNTKIGGQAGYGIMNTGGPIFAKTLLRAGYYVFIYSEYPSLIRGGHNAMQVVVCNRQINAAYCQLDQLVALNAHTIVMHQDEVKKGGMVLYDESNVKCLRQGRIRLWRKISNVKSQPEAGPPLAEMSNVKCQILDNSRIPPLTGTYTVKQAKSEIKLRTDIKFIPVNFTKIAEDVGGDKIMKNVAAVGASLRITNYELRITNLLKVSKQVLADVFEKKGDKIIKANQEVLEAGYQTIKN